MVTSTDDRKGTGNLLLSLYLDRFRQQPFLHRNLDQALSYHDALLKGEIDERWVTMAAAADRRLAWGVPSSRKTLKRLAEKRRPDFRLEVKSIKSGAVAPRNGAIPTRKRAKFAPVTCDIQVTISHSPKQTNGDHNGPGDAGTDLICLRDSRPAQLLFREAADAGPAEFSVDMEPIILSTDKLELPIDHEGEWRSGLSEAYNVDIRVRFKTSQDASLFRSLSQQLHGAETGTGAVVRDLETSWSKFPICTPPGHLLPLRPEVQSSTAAGSMGMEVSMGFRSGKESTLSMYNRAVRPKSGGMAKGGRRTTSARAHRGREILDEIVMNGEGGRALARQVKVGYTCPPQNAFVVERGYRCTICKERRFPSRELLLHHLQNTYYFLDVRVRTKLTASEAKLKLDCIIELEAKKELREDGPLNGTINKEIAFVAPSQPFDISRHVRGLDGWGRNPENDRSAGEELRPFRPSRGAHDHARPQTKSRSISIRARSVSNVPDLPTRPRRTRPVPRIAEGKVLFRLTSKRPLAEGEELSESDEDIDTRWFKPRRDLLVASSDLSEAQKRFAVLWNDYFEAHERLSGDVYMGEATVRFLRARADAIAGDHLEAELEARLVPLVETGVIREEVRQHAREMLERAKGTTTTADRTPPPTATPTRPRRGQAQETYRVFEDDTANGAVEG
ncbi:MAG: hypothetical protein INR71_05570, partial [Terriglobus roseus]|nr:hypothetical protein [Terriglobus roseus]